MAAGAVTMAATAAGLLLSAGIGLFGFTESLAVPYAMSSLVVEFASAAVLAAASALVLAARPGSRASTALASQPGRPGQRDLLSRWPGRLPQDRGRRISPVHARKSNLFPAITRM